MGNVGKPPHRPEGKKGAEEQDQAAWGAGVESKKARADYDRAQLRRRGGPTTAPGMEPVGGSRPGVPSRVEEAIGRRKPKADADWVEAADPADVEEPV